MKKIIKIVIGFTYLLPLSSFAQGIDSGGYVQKSIETIKTWITTLISVLLILAVAWFIWNVVSYTMSSDDKKRTGAKSQMLWGVIAITVIVSLWGIVSFLQTFFGVKGINTQPPTNLIPNPTIPATPSILDSGRV